NRRPGPPGHHHLWPRLSHAHQHRIHVVPDRESNRMTDAAPVAKKPGPRGRNVLLLLLGGTILGVALLLSGPSRERQLCLRTLERRDQTTLKIGSFIVSQDEWTPVPGWPAVELPGDLTYPDGDPRDTAQRLFGDDPEHLWVTIERTMPFAFFIQIESLHI